MAVANSIFDRLVTIAVARLWGAMRIALYQPEIAGNVGAILRLAACFDTPVEVIEPCGFVFSDSRMKRAGMDYAERATLTRHADWAAFRAAVPGRIALLTTHGSTPLHETAFAPGDILLFGSEGSGAPPHVHAEAALRIRIPIAAGLRSLNIGMSAAIALHEALRQIGKLPG